MSASKSQQENAVSEGFALGLCLHGYESLQFEGYKMVDVDLALAHAWRRWPYRATFPAVDKQFDVGDRNGHLTVTHANQQMRAEVFYWDRNDIRTKDALDFPGEADEAAAMICDAVSAEAWEDLVTVFLDRLYSVGPGPAGD